MVRSYGYGGDLPSWLPPRPLCLAKLAATGMLADVLGDGEAQPHNAWDRLIDSMCDRESQIHEALTAQAIRGILSALAYKARSTGDGSPP